MVQKVCILLRVQELKKHRGWITLRKTERVLILYRVLQCTCIYLYASSNLVYLVNQDKWVFSLNLLQALDHLPRHGTNIGPPVTLDLGYVCHPAHTETKVLYIKRKEDCKQCPMSADRRDTSLFKARAIEWATLVFPTPNI